MPLPDSDQQFLDERKLPFQVSEEAGMTCIVFPAFPLPTGLDRATADLLVRLQAGYPDLPPDMWWFDPGVHTANGGVIPATEVVEQHLGRSWQRWSRHLDPSYWQSGIDGLESYLALVVRELHKHALEAAG